jgi:RNA polymerase sigma-70 factor (ECF subfamily)
MTPLRIFDYNFIQHIINENPGSYGQIMEEYYDPILHHITTILKDKEDAKDITNEVFAKVYLNLNLFKPNFKFNSWIYKIATNAAIDFLRKGKLRQDTNLQLDDSIQIIDPPTYENKYGENYATLNDAITKLKPDHRKIIMLRYYEELSYEEIAKRLQCPIGTVKATLHRAKQALSIIITNQKK